MTETPYEKLVPRDFEKNLAFRAECLTEGARNPKAAEELRLMAMRDPLFFMAAFAWTFNSKEFPSKPVRPFIPFPKQEEAIVKINDAIGNNDIFLPKSREMGASWLGLGTFYWRWQFMPHQSFLCASRNEAYVDKAGDDKTLFWKLDFLYKNLPSWLRPKTITRNVNMLRNDENDSIFAGESATGDLGRGGRKTAMLWDELAFWERADGIRAIASTASVTNCRVIISTPNGKGDAFDTLVESAKEKAPHQIIKLHWTDNPVQRAGLYTFTKGKLQILDKEYKFPEDYNFIDDPEFPLRSPYFDKFCIKCPIRAFIKQELEIDFGGSSFQFFNQSMLNKHIEKYATDPVCVGDLRYENGEPRGFMINPKGRIKLWLMPDAEGHLPKQVEYSVGVDISAGTGASNSTISACDRQTGEKILEVADKHTRPEEWARYAVAISRWLNEAFLIWERNGPGNQFGAVVVELGYPNIYYSTDYSHNPPKTSDKPGWSSTKQTKRDLLTEYHIALQDETFINRSTVALKECAEFIHDGDKIIHGKSLDTLDPTAGGDNHGDITIADALANKGLKLRPQKTEPTEYSAPEESIMGRRMRSDSEETSSELVF